MTSTQRFGLLVLDDGANLSTDGGRFGVGDRRAIDRILAALETHDHSGGERLADPVGAPSTAVLDVGGIIPGGSTLFYRVAFVDRFGLETAASSEVQAQTAARLQPPQPPLLTPQGGGTLEQGVHYYALTVEKDGHSTQLGSPSVITLLGGETAVQLDMPTLPVGATGFGIWRQGPTESYYTKIGVSALATVVDDGSVPPDDCATDPSKLPPLTNRTNGTSSVTITAPDTARLEDPDSGIVAWRIYRTQNSGAYPAESLVAEVTEVDEVTGGLVTTYTDTGAPLALGQPAPVSRTLTPSVAIQSGGSGGGNGAVLLEAPGGAVWRVIVDAAGALSTRASGLASYGRQVFLTSPDDTMWLLGVTDGGALSTSSDGTLAEGDMVFEAGFGPHLPTPDPQIDYQLDVNDAGALVTTLI